VLNPPFHQLSTLDLGTHFGKLPLVEKVVTVFFTIVFPIPLVALAIWLALLPGFQIQQGWFLLVILAVTFPLVFGTNFVSKTRVQMGPETAETRSVRRKNALKTHEIDRAITVSHGARVVHFLMNRGGIFVAFGPGLTKTDFDLATQWVRTMADVAGVPYREAHSMQEAMFIVSRDS